MLPRVKRVGRLVWAADSGTDIGERVGARKLHGLVADEDIDRRVLLLDRGSVVLVAHVSRDAQRVMDFVVAPRRLKVVSACLAHASLRRLFLATAFALRRHVAVPLQAARRVRLLGAPHGILRTRLRARRCSQECLTWRPAYEREVVEVYLVEGWKSDICAVRYVWRIGNSRLV